MEVDGRKQLHDRGNRKRGARHAHRAAAEKGRKGVPGNLPPEEHHPQALQVRPLPHHPGRGKDRAPGRRLDPAQVQAGRKGLRRILQVLREHPGGAGNLAAPLLRRPGAVPGAAVRSQDLVRTAGADEDRARRRPLFPQGPHPEGLQGDHARVPALRQGHHRLRGDPAEHLARDVPEQRAHRQDPQARGQEAAGAPGGDQGQEAREVPRASGRTSARTSRKARSTTSTTAKSWRRCSSSPAPRPAATS